MFVNAPPTVSPCVMQRAIKTHCPLVKVFAKRGIMTKTDPIPTITILLPADNNLDRSNLNLKKSFNDVLFVGKFEITCFEFIAAACIKSRAIAPSSKKKKACER